MPHRDCAVVSAVAVEVEGAASLLDAAELTCSEAVQESEGAASMLNAFANLGQPAVPAA